MINTIFSLLLVFDEGVFVDGLDDVFKEDFGGQGVAVMHDGLSVRSVPAVHYRRIVNEPVTHTHLNLMMNM